MAERVTQKQLMNMVNQLNDDLGTKDKVLGLDVAYGGYQLVIIHLDKGRAESDLSRRLKAGEMYEVLYTLKNIVLTMQYNDWLKMPEKRGK